jgi:hypothetical protein
MRYRPFTVDSKSDSIVRHQTGFRTGSKLTLIGESSLSELHTRPDFAVSYANALIGFIEVKAPGKGADPRRFKDPMPRGLGV